MPILPFLNSSLSIVHSFELQKCFAIAQNLFQGLIWFSTSATSNALSTKRLLIYNLLLRGIAHLHMMRAHL